MWYEIIVKGHNNVFARYFTVIINLEWWRPSSVFKSTQERNYLYFIAKVWKSAMTCRKPLTWPCRPGLTSALVIRPAFFLLQDCHKAQFIAANGGDGIPVELFQILKDDAVKVLLQYASKFGKLSSGHRTGKGQFSFQFQRKAMPKNAQTTTQLHSSHMLVK